MADIYCDATNGDDGTGDGSAGNPYASLQTAIDNASGGDTVWIGDSSAQVLATAISWTSGWGGGTSGTNLLMIRGWDYSAGAGAFAEAEIDLNSAVASWDSMTSRPSHVVMCELYLHDGTGHVVRSNTGWHAIKCRFANPGTGFAACYGGQDGKLIGCRFDGGGVGYPVRTSAYSMLLWCVCTNPKPTLASINMGYNSGMYGCILEGGVGTGAFVGDQSVIANCTIVGTPTAGKYGINGQSKASFAVINNVLTGWGSGTGAALYEATGWVVALGYNQFYNNAADESVTNASCNLGNNSTTDPDFVDAASEDYTPQTFVDGYPQTIPGTSTSSEVKIGAVQEAGGGGGGASADAPGCKINCLSISG